MKQNRLPAIMLFLLGLASETQIRIIGYMDISELIAYILGPFFFIMDLNSMRKDGLGTFLFMWFLCCVSCMISSFANHSIPAQWLRGLAVPLSMFFLTCTLYHFLKRDFTAFKWFFLGVALSGIVSTFMFQRGAAIDAGGEALTGADAVERVTSYSLYWLSRISAWLLVPIYMFYLKIPKLYSIAAGVTIMLFGFFSAGNRSGLLVTAAAVLVVLIGGKSAQKMKFMQKHFWLLISLMFLIVPAFMIFYKYCAVHNYLGEKAYQKYLKQTKAGGGAWTLLRSGRSEFFIGLEACLDKPILGHGPHAFDTKGYVRDYMSRYGDAEEYKRFIGYMDKYGVISKIPAHSWIVGFWLWYGVGGLICMLYVGWIMFGTLKNRMAVVPELYGYWAYCLIPSAWHFFFSPFGGRTTVAMMLVLCLMTRMIEKQQRENQRMYLQYRR